MILTILRADRTVEKIPVCRCWMDKIAGMDRLYYEKHTDERGKGKFLPLSEVSTWELTHN